MRDLLFAILLVLCVCSGSGSQATQPILASADASTLTELSNNNSDSSAPLPIMPVSSQDSGATDDLGEGLPRDAATEAVDDRNLLASWLSPQPDYDDSTTRAATFQVLRLQAKAPEKAASFYYGNVYASLSSHVLAGATIVLSQSWNHVEYGARTDAHGYFALGYVPPGTYQLTLSKSASFATLHASILVRFGTTALRLRLLALSRDEQAWIRQINYYRENVSYPRTKAMVIDQYAEIEARRWAADCAAGRVAYSDASYAAYANAYEAMPGSSGSVAGALDLAHGPGAYTLADGAWMAEKANCPRGDWQTCRFLNDTGHYINLSTGYAIWMGVGESAESENAHLPWPGFNAYDVMTIKG